MEEWRDVIGFPGYEVSNQGRVRTHNKITYTKRHGYRHWKDRILKPKINPKDRISRYNLWRDGKEYTVQVHRIVAEAFIPGDTSLTVNHKDGNRQNNTVENLEWLSLADNIRHGFVTGLYPTQKQCMLVGQKGECLTFRSHSEAARFLGRSHGYIGEKIANGGNIRSATGSEYYVI